MMAFAANDVADLRRWGISGALVMLAHAGIAAAMMHGREPADLAQPDGAFVIEFAPVPVGPAILAPEIAPGPEQAISDASPANAVESRDDKSKKMDRQVERVVEEIDSNPAEEAMPELAPAPDAEIVLPRSPPPPQQQESSQRQAARAPAPLTSAPQIAPEQAAASPAAPEEGPQLPKNSRRVEAWQLQVVKLLERNKRYPPAAQVRREQGVARLFFSLDRQGRLIESRVLHSSGAARLDEEALALVRRAQPFPPPPPELTGDRVGLTVPIRFNLK
jgi:protein TonB